MQKSSKTFVFGNQRIFMSSKFQHAKETILKLKDKNLKIPSYYLEKLQPVHEKNTNNSLLDYPASILLNLLNIPIPLIEQKNEFIPVNAPIFCASDLTMVDGKPQFVSPRKSSRLIISTSEQEALESLNKKRRNLNWFSNILFGASGTLLSFYITSKN